ncbi:MAG TPA: BREX-1 system adenine-specific DNA-methyltransferase PglX, partial [Ktedonobacterales bacterium]|nr:BREX-1 system adenine-specific DNA-methyltransferase PglX [Ktedonobacterales bacterium]
MESALRAQLHDLTLEARHLLVTETSELLEGVYGLHRDGHFEATTTLPAVLQLAAARATRARLERLLDDERTAGLAPREAVAKLTKEVAYTWLNRIAAFKMLETRKLIRQSVSRGAQSNGFLRWLGELGQEDDYARYEAGSLPVDALGEGPRETVYRHYLLHLCSQMAAQIRVLFDPDDLPSQLCPRPRALAELLALVNAEEVAPAWADDETIGWIYQYFNEVEKAEVFARLNKGAKITASEIPAATELFTPRWIVRALVENALGQLWLQMHPESRLREQLGYLVSEVDAPTVPLSDMKPAREITLLDPACGTMHFGLVAFDLFAAMYREEMEHAGEPGWPERPSVDEVDEIPAAIVGHNLFGIDIDLRAVQLSALTLFLKAKSLNPDATISQSNLACADILMMNEARLEPFLKAMPFPRLTHERIVRGLWGQLRNASPSQMGSLLRLEQQATQLLLQEKGFYEAPHQDPLPYPELRQLYDSNAVDEILDALKQYLWKQVKLGQDETYFVGEMTKGTRMLGIVLGRYDVIVTNPPYLDASAYNAALKKAMDEMYPHAKRNLYAAFTMRCLELLASGGRLGIITPLTFMAISSFERVREAMRAQASIEMLVETGYGTFPGVRVDTALYVVRAEPDAARRDASVGTYIRLVREPDAEAKRHGFERTVAALQAGESDPAVYRYRQGDFDAIPGAPWVYWITPGLRRLFQALPKLGEIAQPRQGLATADNFRFLRYWWEVGTGRIGFGCADGRAARATGKRWFPHMKGGEFRRWWGNQEYAVNWADDGEELKA